MLCMVRRRFFVKITNSDFNRFICIVVFHSTVHVLVGDYPVFFLKTAIPEVNPFDILATS